VVKRSSEEHVVLVVRVPEAVSGKRSAVSVLLVLALGPHFSPSPLRGAAKQFLRVGVRVIGLGRR